MEQDADNLIELGRISGLYGVRGWVKIFSYTNPRDNILSYSPWYLRIHGQWRPVVVEAGRPQGKGVIAKLADYDDRDQAATLLDVDIAITRDQLPPAEEGEYYWFELIGLKVVNTQGESLGQVEAMMPTGANDVLRVRGTAGEEILIPYVPAVYIKDVDLEQGLIEVDWQADY